MDVLRKGFSEIKPKYVYIYVSAKLLYIWKQHEGEGVWSVLQPREMLVMVFGCLPLTAFTWRWPLQKDQISYCTFENFLLKSIHLRTPFLCVANRIVNVKIPRDST